MCASGNESMVRCQPNLGISFSADSIELREIDLCIRRFIARPLEESTSAPTFGSSFRRRFRTSRRAESLKCQPGHGPFDALAGLGIVIGYDHVRSKRSNRADHSAQGFIVPPCTKGLIRRLRISNITEI